MDRPGRAGGRRRSRCRTARIPPAAWAANEIPGCWSPAPSDPLVIVKFREQPSNERRTAPGSRRSRSSANLTRGRDPARHDLDCSGVAADTDEILARVDRGVGFLTLNRPRAINSLTHSMVTTMHEVLTGWEHDDGVRVVVLSGAGERGLCAGGDVVAVYHSARGDGIEARRFWRAEYLLDGYIGRYSKPYVALMDGIVMGGGVGVGAHANTRVVTDTSKIAMPEVGIGFVPDVGGSYLLSRAPGLLGLHAGLTGAPFSGSDAIAMGFADHYVPHQALAEFTRAIVDGGPHAALDRYAVAPPFSELVAQRTWIDECYMGDTVADIVAALRGHDAGPANDAAHPRPRRGHPRASGRQRPQPEMVAGVAGGYQRRLRRGLLRPGRRRSHLLGTEYP